MHKLLRARSEGQALIVAALAMVVLLALAGLAVDGSMAFEERRRAATAADAAALSATSALAEIRKSGGTGSAIRAAVTTALADHSLSGAQGLQWEARYTDIEGAVISTVAAGAAPPSSARGVRVELGYVFDTFLMPVFGRDTLPAVADATAVYGPIAGPPFGGDLIPLTVSLAAAVTMQNNPGNVAVFGTTTGAYSGVPGNFGAVDLIPNTTSGNGNGSYSDCTGGPVVDPDDYPASQRYDWCNGTPYDINIGDTLNGNTGIGGGSLSDVIDWRIDNRPVGLVPVFDYWNGANGNNAEYRIVGFLAIELTGYQLTGNPDDRHISAQYVDFFVTAGAINPNPNALDTGVYAINLID